MKYLALLLAIVALVICIIPALIVFIVGGICYGCLTLWDHAGGRPL